MGGIFGVALSDVDSGAYGSDRLTNPWERQRDEDGELEPTQLNTSQEFDEG